MVERETVIRAWEIVLSRDPLDVPWDLIEETLELLKEQETEWEHLWDAPDGTFKGRCKNCGFVHFFIEGHDEQYKFCPECGRRVRW